MDGAYQTPNRPGVDRRPGLIGFITDGAGSPGEQLLSMAGTGLTAMDGTTILSDMGA